VPEALGRGFRPKSFDKIRFPALAKHGMKLAYCPTDVRKLKHYLPELIALDDGFTLSYYTTRDPPKILAEPNADGWVTGSRIVLLHRDQILDTATGTVTDAAPL